jgi:twitching motility protein PilT
LDSPENLTISLGQKPCDQHEIFFMESPKPQSNYRRYLRQRSSPRNLDLPHTSGGFMATPGKAPIPNTAQTTVPPAPALLLAMLQVSPHVSDLIFSPGSHPHVEVSGQLVPIKMQGLQPLSPDDTQRIARELIGDNKPALTMLQQQGSCDISYSLPGTARFRVNVFVQRGSYAIVMRVIPRTIPGFADLKLPEELSQICDLKNGIVLVTGPTGSGKSSTLAAILDRINETKAYHILTIEDPVEFIHRHKRSIVDTPSFALALRAALRQAPKVILVGEMRDKETIEIALEAAETGHLVLSTLHTTDASKTVERIIGVFPLAEQQAMRTRFAKSFRYIASQRLLPRKGGAGRVAAIEILKSTLRTREYLDKGEVEGKTLLDAMRDGDTEGMQHFDGEIERLIRVDQIDYETAMAYATNPGNLRLQLADLGQAPPPSKAAKPTAPPPVKNNQATEIELE